MKNKLATGFVLLCCAGFLLLHPAFGQTVTETSDPLTKEINSTRHALRDTEIQHLQLEIKELDLRIKRQQAALVKIQPQGDPAMQTLLQESIAVSQETLSTVQKIESLTEQLHQARKQKEYAKGDQIYHELKTVKETYSEQQLDVLVLRQKIYLARLKENFVGRLHDLNATIIKAQQLKNPTAVQSADDAKKPLEQAVKLVDDLNLLVQKMHDAKEQDNEETLDSLVEQAQAKKTALQEIQKKLKM